MRAPLRSGSVANKTHPSIRYPYYIALKFLGSRRQISDVEVSKTERQERRFISLIVGIAIGGVALGTAALIVTLSILSGFEETLTQNVVGYTSHAEIGAIGNRPLPDWRSTEDYLKAKVPAVKAIVPFVQREAVLRSSHGVVGVLLKGVPKDDSLTLARKSLRQGTDLFVGNDSLPGILLSQGVAEELHVTVGKSIAAIRFHENMTSREDLLANLRKFRVVGIFKTGMTEYDNMRAYTTLEAAQDFSGFRPSQVSGFNVMGESVNKANALTQSLNNVLHYPYYTESVFDKYATIFAWIELQKKPIPIILGLIIIVATFNIISTLLLIVLEKTHDVGVLKSLGASNMGIAKIFATEGAVIAIIGTLIGNIFAFTITSLESNFHFFRLRSDIYFMSSVPVSFHWQHYALVSIISLILALFATLIPARIAAKTSPLKALNFG